MPARLKRHDGSDEASAAQAPRTPERQHALRSSARSVTAAASSSSSSASSSSMPVVVGLDDFASVCRYAYDGLDDKASYSIDDKEGAALAGSLLHPTIVKQMAVGRHFKSLTYGEVLPHSIANDVVPSLRMQPGDVFYDLGSGTGMIPLQVALAHPELAACKGVEFALARHQSADRALNRLRTAPDADFASMALSTGLTPSTLKSSVLHACARLTAIHGSFLEADVTDATVAFINNTVFEPSVMLPLLHVLAALPRLKRVCVIRPLCARHGARCVANGSPCCAFAFPPAIHKAHPTWRDTVPIYTYERVHTSAPVAAVPAMASNDVAMPSPPRVKRTRPDSEPVQAATTPSRPARAISSSAPAAAAALLSIVPSAAAPAALASAASSPPGNDGGIKVSARSQRRSNTVDPAVASSNADAAEGKVKQRRTPRKARVAAGGSPAKPAAVAAAAAVST